MKQRGPLSQLIAVAIVCFSFALFQTSAVFADDSETGDDSVSPSVGAEGATDDGSGDEDVVSAFQNPAQAAHAANLAGAVASVGNEETEELSGAVDDAIEGLAAAEKSGIEEEIETAKTALEEADKALAGAVSELTGVTSTDINDMRAAGMGWGNIAKELGVHPGVLGLGHSKQKGATEEVIGAVAVGSIEATEVAEATARNTRSGYAKGHGLGMNTGVDGETSSLGFGAKSKDKSGLAGASGLSSGQGKAGNNGNRGGDNNSGSSSPGNSGNSNKGGAGVAGSDGTPGGGNSGNSSSNGKDKSSKTNNGKSDDRGNSKK